jgi:TM2 domain-containing membrane protein YozV
MSTGQGSTGNVIAAVCSIWIPGLGQLVQGRVLAAIFQFVLAGTIWLLSLGTLGWIVHLISCIDAARWKVK